MPTSTYVPLQTITLGSSASSVTFASIPQTYRDLVVVSDFTTSASASRVEIQSNSVTSGYSTIIAWDSGSQAFSAPGLYHGYTTGNTRCTSIMQIMDYSATDKHKTSLNRHGTLSSPSLVMMAASRFSSNDAITTLKVLPLYATTFATGSTFSLYAIEA